MTQILVVDDEIGIRELLSEILEDEGYQVRLAENAASARSFRTQVRPDLVLLDIWMPDSDGITLLREWASSGLLTMPVVMMSGHGTIDTAVEATRIGAFDFLEKPIALQKLLATVGRALKHGEPRLNTALVLASLGKGPAIVELRKRLEQVAKFSDPVLLTGATGCGLDICARFLHQSNTPWVEPENTALLAEKPLELLGQARDGLIFVSEIANLNKQEQKGLKLLLNKLEKYNARLVCASTRALPPLVEQGQLDADLFHSVAALTVSVPGLAEHREDIPDLANAILNRCMEAKEVPARHFSTAALNALRNHEWRGNLAELAAVVKTLAASSLEEEISLDGVTSALHHFKTETKAAASEIPLDLPLREARDAFEREYFEYHIQLEKGNMSRVADKVGLERTHLYRKLKQLGVRFSRKSDES